MMQIGTKNTTGQRYRGHYSIWITHDIQEKRTLLHDVFNFNPTHTTGWVNGNLYTPTSEVLGILPIADDIRSSSGMAEYIPALHGKTVKSRHRFLAELQGTRKPVLPVHTPAEKLLFKALLENNPAYNSHSGDPQWKLAVRIWNAEADIRDDVFYKV